MKLSNTDIEILKSFFADKPVKRAYVFGSYSRDEATNESDLDILVDLDYSEHIGLAFVQMKLDLEKKLNRETDLVSSSGLSRHILPFINRDKQLIYEK